METLPKMLLHVKHMSENFTSLRIILLNAFHVFFQLGVAPKPKSGFSNIPTDSIQSKAF